MGIDITQSAPAFSETYLLPFGCVQTYTFEQEIPPGETLLVRLTAIGREAGEFEGDLDVCIDSGIHCLTFVVRTEVQD